MIRVLMGWASNDDVVSADARNALHERGVSRIHIQSPPLGGTKRTKRWIKSASKKR